MPDAPAKGARAKPEPRLRYGLEAEAESRGLDRTARQILAILQTDGQVAMQDLADRVGLSKTPCWRRVKDLEEAGIITGYAALVDGPAVGLHAVIYARISIERHVDGIMGMFEETIAARPEVIEVHQIAGDADYLIKIVLPNVRSYAAFLENVLTRIRGVSRIESSISLKRVKDSPILPVEGVDLGPV